MSDNNQQYLCPTGNENDISQPSGQTLPSKISPTSPSANTQNLKFHFLDESSFRNKKPKNRQRNMYMPTKEELEKYADMTSSALAEKLRMSKTKIIYLRKRYFGDNGSPSEINSSSSSSSGIQKPNKMAVKREKIVSPIEPTSPKNTTKVSSKCSSPKNKAEITHQYGILPEHQSNWCPHSDQQNISINEQEQQIDWYPQTEKQPGHLMQEHFSNQMFDDRTIPIPFSPTHQSPSSSFLNNYNMPFCGADSLLNNPGLNANHFPPIPRPTKPFQLPHISELLSPNFKPLNTVPKDWFQDQP